mgnify:CR=1 FL=1
MSDNLWEEYRRTKFWVDDQSHRFFIIVDELSPELDRLLTLHHAKEWAYRTAHNPRPQRMTAGDHNRRNQRLLKRMLGHGFPCFKGKGVGEEGEWPPEDSYLILGISRLDAISLEVEFGQNAIVVGRRGKAPEIVECKD